MTIGPRRRNAGFRAQQTSRRLGSWAAARPFRTKLRRRRSARQSHRLRPKSSSDQGADGQTSCVSLAGLARCRLQSGWSSCRIRCSEFRAGAFSAPGCAELDRVARTLSSLRRGVGGSGRNPRAECRADRWHQPAARRFHRPHDGCGREFRSCAAAFGGGGGTVLDRRIVRPPFRPHPLSRRGVPFRSRHAAIAGQAAAERRRELRSSPASALSRVALQSPSPIQRRSFFTPPFFRSFSAEGREAGASSGCWS